MITKTVATIKVGFLGLGWIGLQRMNALVNHKNVEICAIADTSKEMLEKALTYVPATSAYFDSSLFFKQSMDAVVIATPNAFHYNHVMQAVDKCCHIFCQKPLAITKNETEQIVEAVKIRKNILGIDFSYRFSQSVRLMKELIDNNRIGEIFAIETIFHNAYGPDKNWFYDPAVSGGGCLLDLGIHLIDLIFWLTNNSRPQKVKSLLLQKGNKNYNRSMLCEDFAQIHFETEDHISASVACSWNLHAGCDAIIKICVHGTHGSLEMKNINGSFYNFETRFNKKTESTHLCSENGEWGSRAIKQWVDDIVNTKYSEIELNRLIQIADLIENIYKNEK
jgi:predicted dehydrogenase